MSRRYPSRRSYRPAMQSYRQRDNHNRYYQPDTIPADTQEAQVIYQAQEPVTITNVTVRGVAATNVLFALVLVPDSYAPQSIITNDPDANMYEPNQFVLASGMLAAGDVPTVRGLNRRLKPGDQIFMITAAVGGNAIVRYNIRFTVLH